MIKNIKRFKWFIGLIVIMTVTISSILYINREDDLDNNINIERKKYNSIFDIDEIAYKSYRGISAYENLEMYLNMQDNDRDYVNYAVSNGSYISIN